MIFLAPAFSAEELVHETTRANNSSENTILPIQENNRMAIVVAVPLDETRKRLLGPVGVSYMGRSWVVYQEAKGAMPVGVKFRILHRAAPDENHYFHVVTKENAGPRGTVLDHPGLNGNPNASFVYSHVYNPEGRGGIQNERAVSARYDESLRRWTLHHVDETPLLSGLAFGVIVSGAARSEPAAQSAALATAAVRAEDANRQGPVRLNAVASAEELVHETSVANNSSENTILSVQENNRMAIVVAVPLEETRKQLLSPVGVWYTGRNWSVYQETKQRMPVGVKFRILHREAPDENHYLHVVTKENTGPRGTVLDHPELNGNSDAKLYFSHVYNPEGRGGLQNERAVSARYDQGLRRWVIHHVDETPFQNGLTFGVIVPGPVRVVQTGPIPVAAIKDVEFDNWTFERGLSGWTATGTAFGSQPTRGDNVRSQRVLARMAYDRGGLGGNYWADQAYAIGHRGDYWVGTYENNPDGASAGRTQGDGPKGTLTSPSVELTRALCDFLVSGGSDQTRLRVELQLREPDNSWKTVRTVTPIRNSELFYRASFDLSPYKGRVARIQIVDDSEGNWGHLNVDDFRFVDAPPAGIDLRDPASGVTYRIDPDAPVWGVADTHAHPTHQEGFGRRLIVGRTDGPLSDAFASSACRAAHCMHNTNVNTVFIGQADAHSIEGWPDFIGYPRFTSKTHHQQHVDFLRRAWQGGLRLYCALSINNMFLPSLALGPGRDSMPNDEDAVMYRQLNEMKRIASQNGDFMEIAYSPADARRIIHQGKLAVVLGVEMDNFGNFKGAGYTWGNDARDAPLVALNDANAPDLLERKLNEYQALGVRQITALHYISGVFGGAAIFRGETALVQFAFNDRVKVKNGISQGIPYNLYTDFAAGAVFFGSGMSYAAYCARIEKQDPQAEISQVNAQGLTSIGELLVQKMMDRGLLIDGEHMSWQSKERLFALAAGNRNYPIMSSHTDPGGLAFTWRRQPCRFEGSDDEKLANFGTTDVRNLATEGQLSNLHYQRVRNSGGTVGVLMLPYRKQPYTGSRSSVPNDCDGSSKTWAQMYLHSCDQMNGRGVALSSDRGMVDFLAPRFGPHAGFNLKSESPEWLRRDERRRQRFAQRNGVRYDTPMGSFHPSWFEWAGDIEWLEEDLWKALAAREAGFQGGAAPRSGDPMHRGRIENFIRGLLVSREQDLEQPVLFNANGDAPWEQAVTFCFSRNRTPESLVRWGTYNQNERNVLRQFYNTLFPIWQTWNARAGNNPVLRRLRTGSRWWDYNTDGMAHYGMLPDFFQDLRNIGVSAAALQTLFRSAEDYIRMWEKADSLRAGARQGNLQESLR